MIAIEQLEINKSIKQVTPQVIDELADFHSNAMFDTVIQHRKHNEKPKQRESRL